MKGSKRLFPLEQREDKAMIKPTCERTDCFFWFKGRCSHICGTAPKRCALFLSIKPLKKASANGQNLKPAKAISQPTGLKAI